MAGTRVLTQDEERDARAAFGEVFASTNVYEGEPFTDAVPRRTLLAGGLGTAQRAAVAAAARAVGDERAYLVHLHEGDDTWWIDLAADDWPETGGGTALVSPSGAWGVLTTALFVDFAVVAWRDDAFAAALRPDAEHALDVLAGLDAAGLLGPGWVETLLVHVYGREEANRLLAAVSDL